MSPTFASSNMVTVAERLRRKFVSLVHAGSNPACHTESYQGNSCVDYMSVVEKELIGILGSSGVIPLARMGLDSVRSIVWGAAARGTTVKDPESPGRRFRALLLFSRDVRAPAAFWHKPSVLLP